MFAIACIVIGGIVKQRAYGTVVSTIGYHALCATKINGASIGRMVGILHTRRKAECAGVADVRQTSGRNTNCTEYLRTW